MLIRLFQLGPLGRPILGCSGDCAPIAGRMLKLCSTNGFWDSSFKSTKGVKNFSCSAQSGFPMRVSDSSVGNDADQVAKTVGQNRSLCDALVGAEGGLRP